ncbi:MAG: hypothetical protein H6632_18280 [Anaerolineales bacterium]|nr:hypothetical protein [Anaerolineales bacterium]
MASSVLLAFLFLLLFLGLLLFFSARVNRGQKPSLRRIQAFEAIKGFTGRAIEAGRALHLSLGTGSMADITTADSLAGLYTLDYLADQSATTGIPPIVSMADPTVMLMAQNTVRSAYGSDKVKAAEAYRDIRWIAPQPAAYAAGVMNLLSLDEVETNIMIGKFGDEYLLMGETAARRGTSHVGGASDPNTLPFIYATAQETLLGEEIYAGGAYLQKRPVHIASLLAQDTMRWIIGIVILGGVAATSLGIING